MDWLQLLSTKRMGHAMRPMQHDRTQFQRDFDRLIFSSPFRRLQDKTQVFPLPGSVFVHNRLTHSLEVSSVGRSLGVNVGRFLKKEVDSDFALFDEVGAVVAAGCLAHDMGNPPFGHSGEKAISDFFKYGEGQYLEEQVNNEAIWNDFVEFEGNANALRLLAHKFQGRRVGGFALTYTTLAAFVKYPYASGRNDLKKYGFFQSEKEIYLEMAHELGINEMPGQSGVYPRHPLVYLVEAADDICYRVMDVEDAHKLGILSTDETRELFLSFFDQVEEKEQLQNIKKVWQEVTDINEQIAYLRAGVIGKLVNDCSRLFCDNHEAILKGTFTGDLVSRLEGANAVGLEKCGTVGFHRIYNDPSVVEVEIAGFKILGTLLKEFIDAVMNPRLHYSKLLLPFVPLQYRVDHEAPVHERVQTVLDFVSGMTDVYALDLYRKLNGTGMTDYRLKG